MNLRSENIKNSHSINNSFFVQSYEFNSNYGDRLHYDVNFENDLLQKVPVVKTLRRTLTTHRGRGLKKGR